MVPPSFGSLLYQLANKTISHYPSCFSSSRLPAQSQTIHLTLKWNLLTILMNLWTDTIPPILEVRNTSRWTHCMECIQESSCPLSSCRFYSFKDTDRMNHCRLEQNMHKMNTQMEEKVMNELGTSVETTHHGWATMGAMHSHNEPQRRNRYSRGRKENVGSKNTLPWLTNSVEMMYLGQVTKGSQAKKIHGEAGCPYWRAL